MLRGVLSRGVLFEPIFKDEFDAMQLDKENKRNVNLHKYARTRRRACVFVCVCVCVCVCVTAIGNAKGHESPFLLALQIVWHRYHNKVAANIKQDSPRLSDDQVFNLARNRVIATFQVSRDLAVYTLMHLQTNRFTASLFGKDTGRQVYSPVMVNCTPEFVLVTFRS